MEEEHTLEDGDLVRCLDCGTVYSQPASEREVGICPSCGYVGWIALSVEQKVPDRER